MNRPALLALLCALVLPACGDRPTGDRSEGIVSGQVVVSGPVSGAVVSLYALDLDTGERGELLGQSEPTGADGAFEISFGVYSGAAVLEARGAAASYVEAGSGATATFEALTTLRAVPVTWDDARGEFSLELAFEERRTNVIISPWSELAVAYAETRFDNRISTSWPKAYSDSHVLWEQHLQLPFYRVRPRSLTDAPVGPWNEEVHAGVLATGLSMYARRIADESGLSSEAFSTLAVLDVLRLDIRDSVGQFDGFAGSVPLSLGSCQQLDAQGGSVCLFDGQSLRGRLNEAVAAFLLLDARNKSGLQYGDVSQLMQGIACRPGFLQPGGVDFFPQQPCRPDSLAPQIAFEDVEDGSIESGTVRFRVVVQDDQALAGDVVFGLTGVPDVRDDSKTPLRPTLVDSTTTRRVYDVEFHSDCNDASCSGVKDGNIDITVTAQDAADNQNTESLRLIINNVGAGAISGTVTAGGRVGGVLVVAYDFTNEVLGVELGRTTADPAGFYSVEIAESPLTTSVLLVASAPGAGDVSYVEPATGVTVVWSAEDRLEAVIADWVDGTDGRIVQITPWTTIASRLAQARYANDDSSLDPSWPEAVAVVHDAFKGHFADGGPTVDIRTARPANLLNPAEAVTFTAQVRYGYAIAGLSELARRHAVASSASPTAMNTLTLTKRLVADVGGDACGTPPCRPVLNGRGITGEPVLHGAVPGSSYWTRADLAAAIVGFTEDHGLFPEGDLQPLLETISLDDNTVLYASTDPALPYDTRAPCTAGAVCGFEAPSPADQAVVRGVLSLRVTAQDDRKLKDTPSASAGLRWVLPVEIVSGLLTTGDFDEDPWVLLGELDTNLLPEGPVLIGAQATDEANNTTCDPGAPPADWTPADCPLLRTIVVDRTPPTIVISSATTLPDGDPLALGGVTGAEEITVYGMMNDANGIVSATLSVNGGPPSPMGAGVGSFETDLGLGTGVNTFTFYATDPAGNVGSTTVTFTRDAAPPVIAMASAAASAKVENEATYDVAITGSGAGTVAYSPTALTDPLNVADGVVFSKYATRYDTAARPNLPQWRWSLSDNHTAAEDVLFEVRILRGGTTVVDWTTSGHVTATGYNRRVTVSGSLHGSLANVSGTYTIQARATDGYGNVSAVTSATWTQTILAPPVRFQVGSLPSHLAGFVRYYWLDEGPMGGVGNNFSKLLRSSELPGGRVRIASWRIGNPNPQPIRVRLTDVGVSVDYAAGRILKAPVHGEATMSAGSCETTRQALSSASCYFIFAPPGAPGLESESIKSGTVANAVVGLELVSVGSGEVLATCAGCAANEYELPPGGDYYVRALADPFTFLDEQATLFRDETTRGVSWPGISGSPLANVTGVPRNELGEPGYYFRQCDKTRLVDGNLVCDGATKRELFRMLTRVKVTFPSTAATAQSRLGPTGTFQLATTTTADTAAATEGLNTVESGYSPLP